MIEVRKAKYVYLLVLGKVADKVADDSNTKQLILVLRFVDESNKIHVREQLVAFLPYMDGTPGLQALADMTLDRIRDYGQDPAFIRGQGYDGAGNMLGKLLGRA